jgi:hypothetical protein
MAAWARRGEGGWRQKNWLLVAANGTPNKTAPAPGGLPWPCRAASATAAQSISHLAARPHPSSRVPSLLHLALAATHTNTAVPFLARPLEFVIALPNSPWPSVESSCMPRRLVYVHELIAERSELSSSSSTVQLVRVRREHPGFGASLLPRRGREMSRSRLLPLSVSVSAVFWNCTHALCRAHAIRGREGIKPPLSRR